jgi:predicted SAM-dependent methyltransferase
MLMLNIGCGSHKLNGFTNIDLDSPVADLNLDVTLGLPYESNTVDVIRAEHFIEHLPKRQAYIFLREARRVLRMGGILRISTPDIRASIYSYLSNTQMDWERTFGYEHVETRCEMINLAMREWGHCWTYDLEELSNLGVRCGFRVSRIVDHNSSELRELEGLDYRKDSIIIEFKKVAPESSIQPKVSILIPAYNPIYFEEALKSALNQNYANTEIVVSDDSADQRIGSIVKRYGDIVYVKNDVPKGGSENYAFLHDLARGEFIKFLNDDDILLPGSVEKMVDVLISNPEVTLVTGYRQRIDKDGIILDDEKYNSRPIDESGVICGQAAFAILGANYIGEPTSTMFRKCDIQLFGLNKHIFSVFGHKIETNVDLVMWLKLLSAGDLAYIVSPLTQFRMHADQFQRRPELQVILSSAFQKLIEVADSVGMRTLLESQRGVKKVS